MLATALSIVTSLLLAPSPAPALAADQSASTAPRRTVATAAPTDIVDAAIAGKFSTLVAAVTAAGLVDTLKGEGPFTVFAPTDEAFAALPRATFESLLLPENKELLQAILLNHVVPGELISVEVANIDEPQMARTAGGGREKISADRNGFRYGESAVTRADIRCGNGVIHAIDRVVLPTLPRSERATKAAVANAEPADLLAALRAVPDGRFSTFLAAVEASGAGQDWAQAKPSETWTLFIPTNDAFARLSESERAALLDPKNRDTLRAVLDWHAVPKAQTWGHNLISGDRGPTMISENNGRFVLDVLTTGAVFVYRLRSANIDRSLEEPFKARVVAGDIVVGRTVVHVVDRVMIPPQYENKSIASQAYIEKDVKAFASGWDARFSASVIALEMVARAESLDDAGAIAMYEAGLGILEDVVPVSRTGMLMMGERGATQREALKNRLRARAAELDRVWYATFIEDSPTATSLDAPIRATLPAERSAG
jgi:uncharacterized surface protein with fasciclin (FAS1) repeats